MMCHLYATCLWQQFRSEKQLKEKYYSLLDVSTLYINFPSPLAYQSIVKSERISDASRRSSASL